METVTTSTVEKGKHAVYTSTTEDNRTIIVSKNGTEQMIEKKTPVSVVDFIRIDLIQKIGQIIAAKDEKGNNLELHWHAFALISIGIEFLGKCIDKKKTTEWDSKEAGESRRNFIEAIERIDAFSGFKQIFILDKENAPNLYDEFRCGLLHMFKPKGRITLSHSPNELGHVVKHGKSINFNCEVTYEIFKNACYEVIKKIEDKIEFDDDNKVYKPILWVWYY